MTDATLDCSDLENYLGKPMQPGRIRDPLANNDIRRWAQAMHYPNRLHYDDDFAVESRFGRIVAPQSYPAAGSHDVQLQPYTWQDRLKAASIGHV